MLYLAQVLGDFRGAIYEYFSNIEIMGKIRTENSDLVVEAEYHALKEAFVSNCTKSSKNKCFQHLFLLVKAAAVLSKEINSSDSETAVLNQAKTESLRFLITAVRESAVKMWKIIFIDNDAHQNGLQVYEEQYMFIKNASTSIEEAVG
jgi:hypothetical protein